MSDEVKIGDIVICIDDRNWNHGKPQTIDLVYKKSYKVLDITSCKCCSAYDIGSRQNPKTFTQCTSCKDLLVGGGIHWAASFRFRKATPEEEKEHYAKEKEDILSQIEELVAKEEYQKAAELQKLIS